MKIINRRNKPNFMRFYEEKVIEPKTFSNIHLLVSQKDPIATPKKLGRNPDFLLAKISNISGVSIEKIKGTSKFSREVLVRQIFCYIAYKQTGLSFSSIGALINRDHSTVIHSSRRIENDLKYRSKYSDEIERIIYELNN